MNCGHTVGPFESGNKSVGWMVPALRLWESGRPRGHASRAGIVEVMWPCPWNCIEFAIYLDPIIYRGCQPILKHTPAPRS